MERVTGWTTSPNAIWGNGEKGLLLAFDDGLARLSGNGLEYITETRIDHAAPGPDDAIYATQGVRVLRFGRSDDNGAPQDVTADFGGAPQGDARVIRGSGGEIFVGGCPRHRCLNGTFADQPVAADGTVLLPLAVDLYGNRWSLVTTGGATQLLVLPANVPQTWRLCPWRLGSGNTSWWIATDLSGSLGRRACAVCGRVMTMKRAGRRPQVQRRALWQPPWDCHPMAACWCRWPMVN